MLKCICTTRLTWKTVVRKLLEAALHLCSVMKIECINDSHSCLGTMLESQPPSQSWILFSTHLHVWQWFSYLVSSRRLDELELCSVQNQGDILVLKTNLKQKASVNVYVCHCCFEVVVLDLTVFQQTLLRHEMEMMKRGVILSFKSLSLHNCKAFVLATVSSEQMAVSYFSF